MEKQKEEKPYTVKCHNCGCEIELYDECYKDGDLGFHCTGCHEVLYTVAEWNEKCIDGYDEDENEIISDYYYYTTLEENEQ